MSLNYSCLLNNILFAISQENLIHNAMWSFETSGAYKCVLEHCRKAIRKLNQSCVRFTPHLCDLWNKSYITNRTSFHSFSWCMKLTSVRDKFNAKLNPLSELPYMRLSYNYLNTLPYLLLVIISMHCRLFLYIVLR